MGFILLVISIIVFRPEGSTPSSTDTEQSVSSTKTEAEPQSNPEPPKLTAPPPNPIPKPAALATPSAVLNLANWKLTLPIETSHPGSPDEIKQPELASYSLNPYFMLNSARNGVVFRAHVGGATTSGSSYPRSELREMTNFGKQNASWSNSSGSHSMIARQAITHLPPVKPEVVAGQIHDALDDVVMIRLEGKRLFVEASGEEVGVLEANYALGTIFTVQIVAAEGSIKVFYNGDLRVNYNKSGSGFYFKAGCYTQSNPARGDSASEYGEVVIYYLNVSHS